MAQTELRLNRNIPCKKSAKYDFLSDINATSWKWLLINFLVFAYLQQVGRKRFERRRIIDDYVKPNATQSIRIGWIDFWVNYWHIRFPKSGSNVGIMCQQMTVTMCYVRARYGEKVNRCSLGLSHAMHILFIFQHVLQWYFIFLWYFSLVQLYVTGSLVIGTRRKERLR